MSVIGRIAVPAAACAHCGAAVTPGTPYCCAGCEAAHGLVEGLGLDAFYRRRSAADGALRPDAAPPVPPPPAHP